MAIQIDVTTLASAHNSNERKVNDAKWLKQLDKAAYSDELCSDYFDFGGILDAAGVTGGKVFLRYSQKLKQLQSVVTYKCERRLNGDEKTELINQTRAQLSDGIGEGYFDAPEDSPIIAINLLPSRAKSVIRQSAVKIKASKQSKVNAKKKRQINICAAAKNGDLKKLQAAIDQMQDLNVPSRGYCALDLAVGSGHLKAVELLVGNGANLESRGPMDFTPLHTCIASSGIKGKTRDKILELLLCAGANVNAKSKHAGRPLDIAYNYGRGKSIKETLVKHGAKTS